MTLELTGQGLEAAFLNNANWCFNYPRIWPFPFGLHYNLNQTILHELCFGCLHNIVAVCSPLPLPKSFSPPEFNYTYLLGSLIFNLVGLSFPRFSSVSQRHKENRTLLSIIVVLFNDLELCWLIKRPQPTLEIVIKYILKHQWSNRHFAEEWGLCTTVPQRHSFNLGMPVLFWFCLILLGKDWHPPWGTLHTVKAKTAGFRMEDRQIMQMRVEIVPKYAVTLCTSLN